MSRIWISLNLLNQPIKCFFDLLRSCFSNKPNWNMQWILECLLILITSVEQSLFKQFVTEDTVLPEFIFLVKKLLCLCTVEFCDQAFSWSSSLRCTEELCSQQPSLVGDWSRVLEFVQLVSHVLGAVYQKEKLSLQNKSNWVLGKGWTVGWYKVLGFLYL